MAERTLIDVMAQALHDDRRKRDGKILQWDECHPASRKFAREDADAFLRALHDHGPTQRMLNEVCGDDIRAAIFAHDVTVRAVFRAMLAAELEERQDHA